MQLSNDAGIIRLTFPGGLREGDLPPPSAAEVAIAIGALSTLADYVLESIGDDEAGMRAEFRIVYATTGSLEVWAQLIGIIGDTVGTLKDGPGLVRRLINALRNGSVQLLPKDDPPNTQALSTMPENRIEEARLAVLELVALSERTRGLRITSDEIVIDEIVMRDPSDVRLPPIGRR